jgi:hypothetical protein
MKTLFRFLLILSLIAGVKSAIAQNSLFTAPVFMHSLRNPQKICLDDFNGDSHIDMVVISQTDSAIAVYFGDGNGTFGEPQIYAVNGEPTDIISRGLYRTGHPDLAVTCGDSNVAVFANFRDGTFRSPIYYWSGAATRSLLADDISGRFCLDLFVCNFDDDNISILASGVSDFDYARQIQYAVGDGPCAVILWNYMDMDMQDLVIANKNSNNIAVLHHGSLFTYYGPAFYDVGTAPVDLITLDYDYDSDMDIFTVNSGSNDVSVLNYDYYFGFGAPNPIPVGQFPVSILSGDFNKDGLKDLIVANQLSNNVSILINEFGRFAPQELYDAGSGPEDIAAADFDGDGDLDLAVTNSFSDSIAILFNLMDTYVRYTPGDVNRDKTVNGIDLTYGINYFKGSGLAPDSFECQEHGMVYAAADFNGNCQFNGIDVVYGVNFFKGSWIWPTYCVDCPPRLWPGERRNNQSGCLAMPLETTDSSYMYVEVRGRDIHVTHMWGEFNCSFDYYVDFQFSGNNITGYEHNIAWPRAGCNCIYNARSSIYNVDPGTYIVTLISESLQDTVGVDTAMVIDSFR